MSVLADAAAGLALATVLPAHMCACILHGSRQGPASRDSLHFIVRHDFLCQVLQFISGASDVENSAPHVLRCQLLQSGRYV